MQLVKTEDYVCNISISIYYSIMYVIQDDYSFYPVLLTFVVIKHFICFI